jgi:hypothetical protein
MRQDTQPWDQIRATLEIVSAGIGRDGHAPTVAIQRISDGQWLQAGGGSWGGTFATNAMNEVSSTNLPGLYDYAIPNPQLDHDAGIAGYRCLMVETNVGVREMQLIHPLRQNVWDEVAASNNIGGTMGELLNGAGGGASPGTIAAAVWDEPVASHVASGTFGRAAAVTLGLVQANHRIKNPTYDSEGRLLTAQLVVYPSSTDAQNDTNPLETFNVTSTYDANGNLQSLLSRS